MDMAVGLSYSGKIPFVYSITPFVLLRPFETIRTYINHEKLHVILVGAGRNDDYLEDGISHWAHDSRVIEIFQNIHLFYPETEKELPVILDAVIKRKEPSFINLKRF